MNEILLRQGRQLDLGRALLGLGGVAEEICGRRLAEQSLVERVQAGAVVVRAFGLKIGVWMEEKDLKNHLTNQFILNMSTCEVTNFGI
jgi:tryptophan synthase beta subunit